MKYNRLVFIIPVIIVLVIETNHCFSPCLEPIKTYIEESEVGSKVTLLLVKLDLRTWLDLWLLTTSYNALSSLHLLYCLDYTISFCRVEIMPHISVSPEFSTEPYM